MFINFIVTIVFMVGCELFNHLLFYLFIHFIDYSQKFIQDETILKWLPASYFFTYSLNKYLFQLFQNFNQILIDPKSSFQSSCYFIL